MAGTKEGAKKAVEKIKSREPGFYKRIGQRGGREGCTGGFASDVVGEDGLTGRERARIAGAKGGRISRRGASKKSTCTISTSDNLKYHPVVKIL